MEYLIKQTEIQIIDEFDDRLLPFNDSQGCDFFRLGEEHMDALKRDGHLELKLKPGCEYAILSYNRYQLRLNKEKILYYLHENINEFKEKHRVLAMGLFGSYARDEANVESDIDIYVLLSAGAKKLSCWTSLLNKLESDLDKKIDLIIGHSRMRPGLKTSIEEEIIWVFQTHEEI